MKSPLYHATQGYLEGFGLGAEARADINATLEALDPKLPTFVSSLAAELSLDETEWRRRSVAVLLMFAATQLADDLADEDCVYLMDAARRGPGTEWLLHQLFGAVILESSVQRSAVTQCFRELAEVGSAQALEVRRSSWDLHSSRRAALGLNGKQWAAYLRLLADGTRYESHAARWGEAWGCSLHVTGDKTSQDVRFTSLSASEQDALSAWALERLDTLAEAPLITLQRSATWFRAVLQRS